MPGHVFNFFTPPELIYLVQTSEGGGWGSQKIEKKIQTVMFFKKIRAMTISRPKTSFEIDSARF